MNDKRTDEQKRTHHILVTATDKYMSGWGRAKDGLSKCAWACDTNEKANKVRAWVESREEMKYVNVHWRNAWKPRNAAHVSIYVVGDEHPALK